MPDVRGLGVPAIESVLSSRHLAIVQSYDSSKTVPAGDVIGQRPAPGHRLVVGGVLHVAVSAGPPPVDIPTVVGVPVATALAKLEAAGFTANIPSVLAAYSATVPAGETIAVFSGNVSDPSSAAFGSALSVERSNGPPPVAIPSVLGLPQAAAVAALQHAGFVPVARSAFSNTVATGSVITTEPSPTVLLQPGQSIHVVVSKGPPVTVPNLGRVTLAQAERELVDAGLTVLAVDGPVHSTAWTCTPGPGTEVTKGSGVTLIAG
jgi:serine/threonine-protein kinase